MKSFLNDDDETVARPAGRWTDKLTRNAAVTSLFDDDESKPDTPIDNANLTESAGETVRRSGLAFSAGIAFFGSVVFMLVLGWFADLLFGSSPWGLVGGIILGSLVGFVQLFRLSSQIFRK